jgi:hypothetical protein
VPLGFFGFCLSWSAAGVGLARALSAGTPSMNILKTIKSSRNANVECHIVSLTKNSWPNALSKAGLDPKEADNLIELPKNEAEQLLSMVLHKELAYRSEVMAKGLADSLSQKLIATYHIPNESKYYSNGHWKDYYFGSNVVNWWIPMTKATFDAGIIIKNKDMFVSVWVQDED